MREALAALRPANPTHPLPPRRADRPKALNALGTLAHHPALTRAYHRFNGHVLFASTLTPRQRELLVLRVAAVRESAYEWAQHDVLAGDAGLEPDEIERVADGPDAPGLVGARPGAGRGRSTSWSRDAEVADDTWAALAGELDEQQLMDLVFTVGAYDLLAMAFRSFGVELDDDLQAVEMIFSY